MRRETVRDLVTIVAVTILIVGIWLVSQGVSGG